VAETSYTYTDVDGDRLAVFGADIPDQGRGANVRTDPNGCSVPTEDTVALAEAILTAGGLTEHRVLSPDQLAEIQRATAHHAAQSMREPCRSFTADPDHPDESLYCEHDDGNGHSDPHYAYIDGGTNTWGWSDAQVAHSGCPQDASETPSEQPPAPDFRVHLLAELLGEDREDIGADMLDDPDTWERAYAVWSLESAELERLRDGESPVLDRVAQLERDMGTVEQRVNNLHASGGVFDRLDALELAARETAQSGGAPRAQVAGGGFTEDGDH
jgi:hypothetical protein